MSISGKMGNVESLRSLEVTVIKYDDIVPWKYPPKKEYIYGEWLRSQYEREPIPEPTYDSDLAIILYQVRENSVPLFGPEAFEILDPIPMSDIRNAMKDSLPGLIDWLKGDEQNVILTLARMWVTAATGEIFSKNAAADWAISRLPKEQADLLDKASKAYQGKFVDDWQGLDSKLAELVDNMKKEIEKFL